MNGNECEGLAVYYYSLFGFKGHVIHSLSQIKLRIWAKSLGIELYLPHSSFVYLQHHSWTADPWHLPSHRLALPSKYQIPR